MEYTDKLYSSGAANRWNKSQQEVIYTSESIALCALELLAHTNGIRPAGKFGLMHIEIEDHSATYTVGVSELSPHWNTLSSYPYTQQLGSHWYKKSEYLVMSVPSAVIPSERNLVLNTRHPDFSEKVRLKEVSDFFWDSRFPSK
ncbi:MAG: RES family NAD+ phosphorylase [Cyclobacteriaceae bacterium]